MARTGAHSTVHFPINTFAGTSRKKGIHANRQHFPPLNKRCQAEVWSGRHAPKQKRPAGHDRARTLLPHATNHPTTTHALHGTRHYLILPHFAHRGAYTVRHKTAFHGALPPKPPHCQSLVNLLLGSAGPPWDGPATSGLFILLPIGTDVLYTLDAARAHYRFHLFEGLRLLAALYSRPIR